MKKAIIFLTCILISGSSAIAQFGISTDSTFTPDNSAMLDVNSTTKGVLIPRMTLTQRDSIPSPVNGLMVYCSDCGTAGALSIFSNNAWRTFAPCSNSSPAAGTHIPNTTSIIWNWVPVPDAIGYKWSTSNNYLTAIDMNAATSKTESGLTCGTPYIRYLWAYNTCGVSTVVVLTQNTLGTISTPVAGTHVPDFTSIIWKWNIMIGADGYKWSTTNNYANAVDMGTATSNTETGLTCNNPYTRYIWAYNSCGVSDSLILTSNTLGALDSPTAGNHIPNYTSIIWNWNIVTGAVGYKWSTTDDYAGATDMGTATSKTETGLTCNTAYFRYVWAYNSCWHSSSNQLTQSTIACYICGTPITINHLVSGGVAPVDKTVTYETVDTVPGAVPAKCWIARNLGASNQPTACNDGTEAASGWYWQFNRKQGYKHDGGVRTPNTTWIAVISESGDWLAANDPCTLELGNGWRIPTSTEWTNVKTGGSWIDWNGPFNSLLKMHGGGYLKYSDGVIQLRGGTGGMGSYFSKTTAGTTMGYALNFNSSMCGMNFPNKSTGLTIRCIKD